VSISRTTPGRYPARTDTEMSVSWQRCSL